MALRRLSKRAQTEASSGGAAKWADILALAKAPGVINLGQGFPDFAGHAAAREAAAGAVSAGRCEQYAPITGTDRLRQAVSDFYGRQYSSASQGRKLDPATEVCVMTSGTEAIYTALMGLVDPGDEVVFFEPFFPWYMPCIRLAGGVLKQVMLKPPTFDLMEAEARLREAFSPKTKLCIVNSPHNPTGHVLSEQELNLVASLCKEHDALCISDEVYEACIFPGSAHKRMCDMEGMWDRTLTIGSSSKLLSLTGWRIGWVYGPSDLVKAASSIHAYTTFAAPNPLQEGVAAALEAECVEGSNFEGRADLMASNWDALAAVLRRTGLEVCPATGGYFLVADVAATGFDDRGYCKWLAEEHKVAIVPLSLFFASESCSRTLVRFAVCKEAATISAAVANLEGATLDLAKKASVALRNGLEATGEDSKRQKTSSL